jgi:DNA helicase-2/ATP-dependent DNA helicase PcrA
MGKGWNIYRFEKILYKDPERLSEKDYDAYIRNRNLFYVGCSRAKKRLALLITIPVQQEFVDYLQKIFGEDNIYEYSQLVEG